MCQYTQTLHACGHPRYTVKLACSKYYYNPFTNAPTCARYTSSTSYPPKSLIIETVMHAFFACGQDGCTYTAEEDPFLDHDVLPRAPKFGASVWNVAQARERKEEDSVMGGTYEPATRAFAAPVDAASFYTRPVEKKRVRMYGGTPPETVRPAPAPGRRVRKVQKKVKQRRGVGRERSREW